MKVSGQTFTIGFPHSAPTIGGPGSFQSRLEDELTRRGHRVVFPGDYDSPDVILVVGGTKKLKWLWSSKRRGAAIVHRLDGINWKHTVSPTPLKHRVIAEARNFLMRSIRNRLADHVIYQSQFVQQWWWRKYGRARCDETVVHNAVDLSNFTPSAGEHRSEGGILLFVEGNIPEDSTTTAIIEGLHKRLYDDGVILETVVCGGISDNLYDRLTAVPGIQVKKNVPRAEMPRIFAGADVYVSLEINPPCPNAVIEALASGVPVVGFDTGSLRELVTSDAGIVVPYNGDPWRLELPDIDALAAAAVTVLALRDEYGSRARVVAERQYDLRDLTDIYLDVFQRVMRGGV